MNKRLQEIFNEARRELRKASGVPLSSDERFEERRREELRDMDRFLVGKFSVSQSMELAMRAILTEDGAVAGKLEAEGRSFRLISKDKKDYTLLLLDGAGDRELIHLGGKDPQFANKILVAVGDALAVN